MRNLLLLTLILFVATCTATPAPAVPTAIPTAAPTETPAPTATPLPTATPTSTPTPTPVPLESLDITDLIVLPGDLPAGYSTAQLRDTAPQMYRDLPPAAKTIYQQFAKDDKPARGVAIFLYSDPEDRQTAYTLITEGMVDESPLVIGDQASGAAISIMGTKMTELVYRHCASVVHISFSDMQDIDAAISYAKNLDARLSPIVCQYP